MSLLRRRARRRREAEEQPDGGESSELKRDELTVAKVIIDLLFGLAGIFSIVVAIEAFHSPRRARIRSRRPYS